MKLYAMHGTIIFERNRCKIETDLRNYYGESDAANQLEEKGTKGTGSDKACLSVQDMS